MLLTRNSRAIRPRQFMRAVGGKAFEIPEDGWNASNFARYGAAMILTLARAAKITQRLAAPVLAGKAKAMFKRQIEAVNQRVIDWSRTSRKALTIDLPQNAELWVQAMNEVFAEANIEAVATLMPTIQSTMAQGYSKTSIILGHEAEDVSRIVTVESRSIARRITRISETTRRELSKVIVQSVQEGKTVYETVADITEAAPKIYGHRALTIARTELNNAWTRGSILSMQQSSTLTHISVIGCEAREPRSPHYQGESTCNYPDLPIGEVEAFLEVGFHPNHTGQVVPSRFRNEDGTASPDGPRPALLNE